MNIYLISANSYHLIDTEIQKIVLDNPYLTFNLNQSSLNDVLDEASYFSLTGEVKYIVASNANFLASGKISEAEQERFLKYLNQPNSQTVLILTTLEAIDNRKKIVKALKDKYTIINILPWDKKRIREEANKYLLKYKYKIDYNTMSYILDNVYNNIDILFNELDKIMLYYHNPGNIELKDVELIVGRQIDNNNFHFINAVINKDLKEALRILKDLKVYKVESVSLINLLAREYRLMYMVKRLTLERKSLGEISQELNLQDWQVDKLYHNGLKYQEKELLKNLYYLGNIDLKIKKGLYDKDLALYPFLLEACL